MFLIWCDKAKYKPIVIFSPYRALQSRQHNAKISGKTNEKVIQGKLLNNQLRAKTRIQIILESIGTIQFLNLNAKFYFKGTCMEI